MGICPHEIVAAHGGHFRHEMADTECLDGGIIKEEKAAVFEKAIAMEKVLFHAFVGVVSIDVAEADRTAESQGAS